MIINLKWELNPFKYTLKQKKKKKWKTYIFNIYV